MKPNSFVTGAMFQKTFHSKCKEQNPSIYSFAFAAFFIQRGRVALRLDKVDVQCRLVKFKSSFEVARGTVHLQTTINYFNYTGSFVHDAAVTWIESVNMTSFEVCALKAGRAERVTPDGGLTFVDYIAFQEAPVNAVAGQQVMKDWWVGTNCKDVSFSSVSFITVLVIE